MVSARTMHPAFYRAYQFFVAVRASLPGWAGGSQQRLSLEDEALVRSILEIPAQQQLFAQMPPNDRRHAVAVARTLQAADFSDPALLQAALLHDVAKSLGQPIVHRVLIVLLEAFWPALLARLSRWSGERAAADDLSGVWMIAWWRRPFVIHAWHPQLGAVWARQAGCNPLAIELIARHQDKVAPETVTADPERLLVVLQWADDLN